MGLSLPIWIIIGIFSAIVAFNVFDDVVLYGRELTLAQLISECITILLSFSLMIFSMTKVIQIANKFIFIES